jgi:hypothetical protein
MFAEFLAEKTKNRKIIEAVGSVAMRSSVLVVGESR